MKDRDYCLELGGYAETESVIDGDYEELISFNFCIACDYLSAIYSLDFQALGRISSQQFIDTIYWYNMGSETPLTEVEQRELLTGRIIMSSGRSLMDEVIDNRNDCLAWVFLSNGNNDARLLALCTVEDEYPALLSPTDQMDHDEYIIFLREVFDLINNCYEASPAKKQIAMLKNIKANISSTKYSKNMGGISLNEVGQYQFVKDMLEHKG